MRYLVLSDIHSNLVALEAVLAHAGPVDAVWCLGDTVGYGPQPNECVARVQGLPGLVCVAGNHDWAALGKVDLSDFNTEARLAAEWTARQLTPESRTWLAGLPERVESDDFTLVHGSPQHPIWEYVLTSAVAAESFSHFGTQACLVGHSHVAVIFLEPGRQHATAPAVAPRLGEPFSYRPVRALINPGSVGQPRDGDPEASYLLVDTTAATVVYQRVPYAVGETQRRMRSEGLPPALAARLAYGW